MVNFKQTMCTFFLGIAGVAVGESEEWRHECTIGTIALKSWDGTREYVNATTGRQGANIQTYHPHCSYQSEHFQCILLKEGPVISNLRMEIENQKEQLKQLAHRIEIASIDRGDQNLVASLLERLDNLNSNYEENLYREINLLKRLVYNQATKIGLLEDENRKIRNLIGDYD